MTTVTRESAVASSRRMTDRGPSGRSAWTLMFWRSADSAWARGRAVGAPSRMTDEETSMSKTIRFSRWVFFHRAVNARSQGPSSIGSGAALEGLAAASSPWTRAREPWTKLVSASTLVRRLATSARSSSDFCTCGSASMCEARNEMFAIQAKASWAIWLARAPASTVGCS